MSLNEVERDLEALRSLQRYKKSREHRMGRRYLSQSHKRERSKLFTLQLGEAMLAAGQRQ